MWSWLNHRANQRQVRSSRTWSSPDRSQYEDGWLLWGVRCERDIVGRQQQPRFREWPFSAAWWFAYLQCLRNDALPGLHFQKGWERPPKQKSKNQRKRIWLSSGPRLASTDRQLRTGRLMPFALLPPLRARCRGELPRLSWWWWQWWSPPHTLTSEIWSEVNKWMCGNCFVPHRVGSQAPAKNKVYVVSESTWRTTLTCIARRPTLPCVRNVIVRNQKECGYQQDAHTGVVGQPWTITLRRNVSN